MNPTMVEYLVNFHARELIEESRARQVAALASRRLDEPARRPSAPARHRAKGLRAGWQDTLRTLSHALGWPERRRVSRA